MRGRILVLLALCVSGFATYSLTQGQPQPGPQPVEGPRPTVKSEGGLDATSAAPAGPSRPTGALPAEMPALAPAMARDLSKLSPFNKQMLLSAQRGADWLFRMNGVKGRFLYGHLPAVKIDLDGDHYLRQVGAAFALARAARFLGEERYTARAAQAVLTLLEETATDPNDPQVRYTSLPPVVINRLGAAGLLVAAINELPAPQADLLEKSEQLCNYIRRQARPDGSLSCHDDEAGKARADDVEAVCHHPGAALYGLVRSQRLRPAAWKLDMVRKAAGHYRTWWPSHKSLTFVPWQTAACTEAFQLTREPAFADFVFEMNDWVCGLQYDQIDPRRLAWYGGFKGWADGRTVEEAPQVGSAAYAEGLVEARRVAREAGDVARDGRYGEALGRCLQFLTTLQYTEGTTQHFADWYRPRLVGAFHATHQDGNLRIDYTQQAVSALVQFLEHAAR